MKRSTMIGGLAALAMTERLTVAASAAAAPLAVLCAGATLAAIRRIASEYEQTHARTVTVSEGTAGQLRARLAAGAAGDVVVISSAALDALADAGDIIAGSRVELGRTGIGVGVRAGSPLPDLSTVDAFKQTLLSASSIATTDPAAGASSGIYFAGLLEKLDIAAAVRPKLTLFPGGYSCDLVAAGKADLCVQNISEIVPVRGVVVAGPLPAAVQQSIGYAAAILTRAADPAAARDFLADATGPARAALWRNAGFATL